MQNEDAKINNNQKVAVLIGTYFPCSDNAVKLGLGEIISLQEKAKREYIQKKIPVLFGTPIEFDPNFYPEDQCEWISRYTYNQRVQQTRPRVIEEGKFLEFLTKDQPKPLISQAPSGFFSSSSSHRQNPQLSSSRNDYNPMLKPLGF